ncbi:xanthine dehydrogenase family protein molybdopterin-binding subunit [Aciditerrimonas ferrireducens]|uniref:xanthine dehydrogenase family protein molybdopterin-binding subunit n=1 Tax=Aciditerrimonas ferrireducens TaxID=667306 RepID=UPI002003C326|nr:xanthine dehydrogenase family protein molybdopterin-binding subunit [Aciditerrimonas ferrireducens]MCK4178094.1 xanthine dehydrogenase family protein molybdopterin-binding subunit [Aciditerrimonas ferrireducens]
MSILGNWVPRVEDPRLLTEGGRYVDDLRLEGAVHAHFVRAPLAHGEIRGIDVEEARRAPGVVAVLTAEDLGLGPLPVMGPPPMARPPLATGRVRFAGEPVAVVVAETRAQAVDAAELVGVDLEPLPALVDPERALAGEVLLFPEAGTNVCGEVAPGPDDEAELFAGCDVVVRQRIVNQRLAPCPLEVRGAAAAVGEDGRLTLWMTTQHPHGDRDAVAAALGLEPSALRVVAPDVGGGFGSKIATYPEQIVVAALARRLGRPVRWTETRSESMLNLGHGRAQIQQVAIGGTRDGRVLALSLEVLQDAGAYPALGAFLPNLTRMMATGVYDVPKVRFRATSVVTTTTPVVAYRGAGRPEAAAAIERAMDLFAAEIGMDPAEVRRRNFVAPDRFPYTTRVGTTYDSGDYPGALTRLLDALDYPALRAEQARRRAEGSTRQLGIGLSTYVEVTGAVPGAELGAVEVRSDGTAVVRAGTFSHGQGHATAFAMLVADRLGIPLERIEFRQGDTDEVPRGMGTYGSRSLQSGGVAVVQAAEAVLAEARRLAAERLEANPEDIVADQQGRGLHVAGAPARTVGWDEVVAAAGGRLVQEVDFAPPGPTFPFGAHAAVVEVDVETGAVRVVRMVAVDDAGTLLNPLLAAGQVHGGLAQGVAQALLEEFVYDDDGNPLTANLADYPMVSATELPSFERIVMETPTPLNELGAKGIGESGTIGSTPAVQNAVCDALAHLGVRHLDMPTRPERVWRALQDARVGAGQAG